MSFTSSMESLNLQIPEPSYDINQISLSDISSLTAIKKEIEDDLSLLFDNLEKQNANMDTGLLTFDGFPRADIDVVQVRLIRTRIIRLRNDLKVVLETLEIKLQDHFSNVQNLESLRIEPEVSDSRIPFAIVSEIVEGSPASAAGLKVNDRILMFGGLHAGNHDRLKNVNSLSQESENKAITILIFRVSGSTEEKLSIELTPNRAWNGKGLLGCRLVPL